MAISYPTSLDSFTNPSGTSLVTSPDHAGQHSDNNDAVEALEAKVGLGAGTPTLNKILVGTGNGTATWGTAITNLNLTTPQVTTSINDSAGNEIIKTPATASAVNEITVTNSATGNAPSISATGGDTNIDLNLVSKGSGVIKFNGVAAPTSSASADGWIAATGTWTYASASTITVPSGAASLYQKGDRIKWTQTTVKYGVIVTVADTLLTIAVNNDYTVANAAITLNYYSHQVNPIGYPTWFGYDPTWTGFSAAPTQDVLYSITGNSCTVLFNSNNGTSNSATFEVTLPVAASTPGAADLALSIAVYNNGSWNNTLGVLGVIDSSATAKIGLTISTIAGGTYAGFTTSNGKGVTGMITFKF